jgi:hypothetical protein
MDSVIRLYVDKPQETQPKYASSVEFILHVMSSVHQNHISTHIKNMFNKVKDLEFPSQTAGDSTHVESGPAQVAD